jgi:hypothetical protein
MHVLVDERTLAQGHHEGSKKIELHELLVVTMREDRACASPGG